jgi:hypothetical protein
MRGMHDKSLKRTALAALVAAALSGAATAQTNGVAERFSAVAVNLDAGSANPIQIAVERWSSDAERDKLMNVMLTKGANALLDALQDAPRVGYIRTNTSLGWDLHFARKVPGKDGGEQIILATDRPMSFSETWNQSRTVDYPFTVIELHVNNSGEGDGTMSWATKIIPDKEKNVVVLENYGTQRIRLNQVKREGVTN